MAFWEEELPGTVADLDPARRALLSRVADAVEGLDTWAPLLVQERRRSSLPTPSAVATPGAQCSGRS